MLEEHLFSVIFMNIDLRKVKEIANWTYHSKLELLESCFGHQLSCAIFMNIGLRKVKEIAKWIYLVKTWAFRKMFRTTIIMRDFYEYIGLNRIKKLWLEFIKRLWKDAFELNVNYHAWFLWT